MGRDRVRRVWLMGGVVLALAGAGAFNFGFSPWTRGAAEAPYRVAAVDRGPITASVRATGTLNPLTTVLVGSQLSGQVVEILADFNSPVKAGQVVARLNGETLHSRRDAAHADLAQARADLAMRQAQADKSRALLARAEASGQDLLARRDHARALAAEAQRNLDRQAELNARAVGTQTALEQARTQVEIQRAALASAEAQIASNIAEAVGLKADIALAGSQVQAAEAVIRQREAKTREIEIDLARTEIRSPVDGVVVKREIELGLTVAASLSAPTLFTVAQDLREIDIYANIDEADVGRLKAGQSVGFTVGAYPNRSFAGSVRMVRLGAQTVQNVVTYTAVIGVDNDDMALLPGMTANLQIVTDERPNALRIPNAALRFRPPAGVALPPAPLGPLTERAVAAPAPDDDPFPARGARARTSNSLRDRITEEVRPTPEQAAALDRIFAEARENRPRREPGVSDEERRASLRQARQDMHRRIAAALDPERRARFEAMTAEGRRSGRAEAAADAATPGRVYVLDANGRPQAVAVRLGITDGSTTELVAGDLAEGAALVVGGGPRGPAAQPVEPGTPSPAQRSRGQRLF
jgi:HlyD family secretion protein